MRNIAAKLKAEFDTYESEVTYWNSSTPDSSRFRKIINVEKYRLTRNTSKAGKITLHTRIPSSPSLACQADRPWFIYTGAYIQPDLNSLLVRTVFTHDKATTCFCVLRLRVHFKRA